MGDVACTPCKGNVRNKVYACALHGECTLAPSDKRDCSTCDERQRFAPITTRHLLYHCYPRSGSRWRERVLRLRERDRLFNGRKIMAIVTDATCDPWDHVARELDGLAGWEFIPLANDPTLREVASFLPLFERVSSLTGPGDATLWAHAKGATRGAHRTAHRWVEMLEAIMLGDWPTVEAVLSKHPVAGCFK